MKKTAILLALLLHYSFYGFSSEDSIKIRSVKETTYDVIEKFGEISKGKVSSFTEYKYDNNGNRIERNYWSNDYEAEKTITKYDNKGNMIEEAIYNNEELAAKVIWKYNDKGLWIEQSSYGADKALLSKEKRKYDNNKKIEETAYDSQGKTVAKEIFEYDARGYYAGHTKYENGKLAWKCTHKLDDRGNLTHRIRIGYRYEDSNVDIDTLWIRTDKYNEFDKMIEFENFTPRYGESNPTLAEKQIWKRDNNGNLMEWRKYYNLNWEELFYDFAKYNIDSNIVSMHGVGYHRDLLDGGYKVWYKQIYDNKKNCIEIIAGYMPESGMSTSHDFPLNSVLTEDGKTGVYVWSNEKAKQVDDWFNKKNKNEFDIKKEYVYTYDKHGNWITKTIYEQKKNSLPTCTSIVEREIEYYE